MLPACRCRRQFTSNRSVCSHHRATDNNGCFQVVDDEELVVAKSAVIKQPGRDKHVIFFPLPLRTCSISDGIYSSGVLVENTTSSLTCNFCPNNLWKVHTAFSRRSFDSTGRYTLRPDASSAGQVCMVVGATGIACVVSSLRKHRARSPAAPLFRQDHFCSPSTTGDVSGELFADRHSGSAHRGPSVPKPCPLRQPTHTAAISRAVVTGGSSDIHHRALLIGGDSPTLYETLYSFPWSFWLQHLHACLGSIPRIASVTSRDLVTWYCPEITCFRADSGQKGVFTIYLISPT